MLIILEFSTEYEESTLFGIIGLFFRMGCLDRFLVFFLVFWGGFFPSDLGISSFSLEWKAMDLIGMDGWMVSGVFFSDCDGSQNRMRSVCLPFLGFLYSLLEWVVAANTFLIPRLF